MLAIAGIGIVFLAVLGLWSKESAIAELEPTAPENPHNGESRLRCV